MGINIDQKILFMKCRNIKQLMLQKHTAKPFLSNREIYNVLDCGYLKQTQVHCEDVEGEQVWTETKDETSACRYIKQYLYYLINWFMKCFFLILIFIHFLRLHLHPTFSSIFLSVPAPLNFSQSRSTPFAFSSFSLCSLFFSFFCLSPVSPLELFSTSSISVSHEVR